MRDFFPSCKNSCKTSQQPNNSAKLQLIHALRVLCITTLYAIVSVAFIRPNPFTGSYQSESQAFACVTLLIIACV